MNSEGTFMKLYIMRHGEVELNVKKLLNGNGCVLATSGAGKSFSIKLLIEQVLLRYPEDEVCVIDPQR